jgi:lipopolysaccharide/colanic/teichoic acid biosynthesis glycosyltransferase
MHGKIARRLLISEGSPTNEAYQLDMPVLDVKSLGPTPDLHDPARMAELSRFLWRYDIVYLDGRHITDVASWITVVKATGVPCQLVVRGRDIYCAVGIERLGDIDTLVLSRGPLSFGSRLQKRLFDLVLVVPLLVITTPLMVATAIAIRLETRGPALFTQQRTGLANRPFKIFKFRSMHVEKLDERGDRSAARDDDRTTRVGRFIRRFSIDEIPQLFNVLLGDMSLVGPRPHAEGSRAGDQLFWEISDAYWLRHALKPGITGLAQINGYRGATDNRSDLEARLSYDLEYLQSWSLWNDVTILFATLKVVSHANAY